MNTRFFLILIFTAFVSACQYERYIIHSGEDSSAHRIIQNENLLPKEDISFLPGDFGNYKLFLGNADYVMTLSSTKLSPLEPNCYSSYIGLSGVNTKSEVAPTISAKVNGADFLPEVRTKSDGFAASDYYGKNIIVAITKTVETKGEMAGNNTQEVGMYVPNEIVLLSPSLAQEEDLYPLCYYDGFQIRWNEDVKNTNGIIVVVDWFGETVLGKDVPNTRVRRFCSFPDTGTAVLDTSLFDGIPDTAVCHMTLLRGNIAMVDLDEETCKVMMESHEYFTFVLIREVTSTL